MLSTPQRLEGLALQEPATKPALHPGPAESSAHILSKGQYLEPCSTMLAATELPAWSCPVCLLVLPPNSPGPDGHGSTVLPSRASRASGEAPHHREIGHHFHAREGINLLAPPARTSRTVEAPKDGGWLQKPYDST